MAKQGITTGTTPNDGTGDTLLAGAVKINSNFNELYTYLGNGSNLNYIGGRWSNTNVGINTLSNVGIGTTNPTSALTVTGDTKIVGVLTANTFIGNLTGNLTGNGTGNVTGTASTASTAQALTGTPTSSVADITASGKVSAGGSVTGATIHGNGAALSNIVTSVTAGAGVTVSASTGGITISSASGGAQGYFQKNATGINTSSNVGIGTTTATSALTVTGSGKFTGIVTATTFVGNVTGNLSGQASALSGSRTIGGVVFDNTADINLPGVNTGGNQNTTGSAATLTTPRAINGTNFDGSAAITVTAAAGTLTGGTLASGVTASSLTSVGTLTGLTVSGAVSTGDLTVLDPTPDLKLQDSNHTGNNTEHTIYFKDSTGANQINIGSPSGEQHLRIKHDTTELIKIQTDGKVGIGTTSPTQLLELNGASTPSVQVKDTTNNVICRVGADDTSVLLGGRSNHAVKIYQNDATAVTIDTSKNTTFAGTVSDSKGDVRKIVQNHKTSAYVLIASDAGKCITISTGGVTVNTNIFTAGDAVTIINHSGSDQTITQGSSFTLHNAADAATGNRTLAGRGMATIWFENVNEAYISGAGLS